MANSSLPPNSASKLIHDRRAFNPRERLALFLAAQGRCQNCGAVLSDDWHADHIQPWSKGGATDVTNGQALCSSCNLKKGNRIMELRLWQEHAINAYFAKDAENFLASATPGAGKTTFALELAARELRGRIRRVIVVVPTRHLRIQWADAAMRFGLHLDPTFENSQPGGIAADYHGVVVTYQSVASFPERYRQFCAEQSTLVIFDEIHHAADHNSWGNSIQLAFELAFRRLLITGTPFRGDRGAIPFVEYDADGRCIPDSRYDYGRAVNDSPPVVRPIYFPSFEAEATWQSGTQEYSATFADAIPTAEDRHRLRTALDPRGDWIESVLRKADTKLLEIRAETYERAAGLVIATDQQHAREIAAVLESITGQPVVIATSDEDDASEKIRVFADGGSDAPRWIVAVRMVSEGVDIPRLFVGVWATVITTELYFRQVVGRFVRLIDGIPYQAGYLYVPAVDWLLGHISNIKIERDYFLDDDDRPTNDADDDLDDNDDPRTYPSAIPSWTAYGATAHESDLYALDQAYSTSEMQFARTVSAEIGGVPVPPEVVVQVLRAMRNHDLTNVATASRTIEQPQRKAIRHDQKKKKLKEQVNRKVNYYKQLREDYGSPLDWAEINGELKRRQGITIAEATLEQLQERIRILDEWIEDISNGSR